MRSQDCYVRLSRVLDHVEANLCEQMRVGELARIAGSSVSQLERDFKDVLGLSPAAHIADLRLERALFLLEHGESLAQLAHACGYADQSAFTRRFHRSFGLPPSQYRRAVFSARDGA
jgi:transcriptional regulator GlxA family with amidase domain